MRCRNMILAMAALALMIAPAAGADMQYPD